MFSVSELHNFGRQYHYLFKFHGLIRSYIVPYFLLKKSLLLPTYYEIRGLVGSQNGANIHMSVPQSLQYLPTNLYTSVVDFIYFRRLVESPLEGPAHMKISQTEMCVYLSTYFQFSQFGKVWFDIIKNASARSF